MTNLALDADIATILDKMGVAIRTDLNAIPLESAIKLARPVFNPTPQPANSEDITVPTDGGHAVRVRLYFPEVPVKSLPVLVHIHGGGFVSGTVEMEDKANGNLARDAACIVASVDYRLSPEYPFPTAIEDAFAAWRWIVENAATFGGDPARCAISGTSAGGHIAIGVVLLARTRRVPLPKLQILSYPMLDPDMNTGSYREFTNGPFMSRSRMVWYWKQYTGAGGHEMNELWSPKTASPEGLPPAHIITAEYDVLRDEGEAYAAYLKAAGISTTVKRYPRMIHGFVTVVPENKTSVEATAEKVAALRKCFAN
jgi:acetyl esterase